MLILDLKWLSMFCFLFFLFTYHLVLFRRKIASSSPPTSFFLFFDLATFFHVYCATIFFLFLIDYLLIVIRLRFSRLFLFPPSFFTTSLLTPCLVFFWMLVSSNMRGERVPAPVWWRRWKAFLKSRMIRNSRNCG